MKNTIFSLVFICVGYFNGFAQDPFLNYGVMNCSITPIAGTQDIQISFFSIHPTLTHYDSHNLSTNEGVTNISVCMAETGLTAIGYETTNLTINNINTSGTQTIILGVHTFQQIIETTCDTNLYFGGPYTINFTGPITQSQTYVLANENFIKPISKLYPNPNNGIFQIDLPNQLSEAQLEIFDFSGKEILVKEAYQSGTTVDVSTLSAGLYFVKISTPEHSEVLKFVVK